MLSDRCLSTHLPLVLQNHNHQDRKWLLWPYSCLSKKQQQQQQNCWPLLNCHYLKLHKVSHKLIYFQIMNSKWMPRGHHSSHFRKYSTKPWHIPFKEISNRVSLVSHNILIYNFQKFADVIFKDYFMLMKCRNVEWHL